MTHYLLELDEIRGQRNFASMIVFLVFILSWFWVGSVYAHSPTDSSFFADWHWRLDVLLVVAFFGAIYVRGWQRLRQRAARVTPRWQLILYLAAGSTFAVAYDRPSVFSLGQPPGGILVGTPKEVEAEGWAPACTQLSLPPWALGIDAHAGRLVPLRGKPVGLAPPFFLRVGS